MKQNTECVLNLDSERELLKIAACELIKIGAKFDLYLNGIKP